jgi:hypothetical protein
MKRRKIMKSEKVETFSRLASDKSVKSPLNVISPLPHLFCPIVIDRIRSLVRQSKSNERGLENNPVT